ncbi:MAG: RidA family protein [Hyphomonadaceae bacterium]
MARRSINIEGFGHGTNPTPAATRIGNTIYTGSVSGTDRKTQKTPQDLAEQTRLVFENMGAILEAGGATWDDVIFMKFFTRDANAARDIINAEWRKVFTDPAALPSRHVITQDIAFPNVMVQAEAVAIIER